MVDRFKPAKVTRCFPSQTNYANEPARFEKNCLNRFVFQKVPTSISCSTCLPLGSLTFIWCASVVFFLGCYCSYVCVGPSSPIFLYLFMIVSATPSAGGHASFVFFLQFSSSLFPLPSYTWSCLCPAAFRMSDMSWHCPLRLLQHDANIMQLLFLATQIITCRNGSKMLGRYQHLIRDFVTIIILLIFSVLSKVIVIDRRAFLERKKKIC